jgi:Uma2 family endonuclease
MTIAASVVDHSVLTAPMTEAEFMALDGVSAEWVEGVVHFMSPVTVAHDDLRTMLTRLMSDLIDEAGAGGKVHGDPFVAKLRPGLIRSPDLMYIAPPSLTKLENARFIGGPDLVVEIVSPESVTRDYRDKLADYEAAGVREYWIFDPRVRTFEVHRLGPDGKFARADPVGGRVTSNVLPKFLFDQSWLAVPLPKKSAMLADMLASS